MKEAEIEARFMSGEQQHAFEIFVGLGENRSLPALHQRLVAEGMEISESQLKRWSSKFKWFELAQRTEQHIAQGVADAALPAHQERVRKELDAINKLKEKFYADVDAGKVEVTLADFMNLVKTERLILGDPTERSPDQTGDTNTQINIFSGVGEGDVLKLIRTLAHKEAALPPAKNVTPDEQ